METTMTATRIDRGSTDTTTIYSEGGDLTSSARSTHRASRSGRPSPTRRSSRAGGAPTARRRPSSRWTSGRAAAWRYVSSAPDRDDVAFFGEYLEIDPPKGFKWTFLFDVEGMGPQGGPETFTFEDLGGKTKVISIGHMGSAEAIDGALATGMVGGALETWDRLAAVLAEG